MRDKLGVILVSLAVVLCTSIGYGQEMKVSERTLPVDQDQNRDPNEVYLAVQIKAEPYGGMAALNREFKARFNIPEVTIKDGSIMRFQIIIRFIIEKDGSLSDIMTLRDPGSGLGEEAVRVLSEITKWKPAIQNNKNVRSQFTLPITIGKSDINIESKAQWGDKAYLNTAVPIMGEYFYVERLREEYKKIRYHKFEDKVNMYLSINEEGEVVGVEALNAEGMIDSSPELLELVKSLGRWLPARINKESIKDVVAIGL